jgi:hypothetical protein
MIRIRTSRLVFAATVATALGFGSAQAVAAPPEDRSGSEKQVCAAAACNTLCTEGLGFACGKCVNGRCMCFEACR